jgi:hypothetical protein
MVETYSENCNLLDSIYGTTTSEIIKQTVSKAQDETQCSGIKFFSDMTDRNLIISFTAVCY